MLSSKPLLLTQIVRTGLKGRSKYWSMMANNDFKVYPDYQGRLINLLLTVYLQACILVFDVTNKLSFDSLEYWLQEFTSNGGKQAVIAVVANKVGLVQLT